MALGRRLPNFTQFYSTDRTEVVLIRVKQVLKSI